MDDTYQTYVNRVARMTLPESYQSQVPHIQPSPKFQLVNGEFRPASFPGYTVITPPESEDTQNVDFYNTLLPYQQYIVERLGAVVVPVPSSSFHVTLADLLWDSAYRHAIANPDFEPKLHDCIALSFHKCQAAHREPPNWQVIGLFVRARAIGVALVPNTNADYERVVALRRSLYQDPTLISLGIEQQYNFTAHVTLGYFTEAVADLSRDQLGQILIELNQTWLDDDHPESIQIHRAELRKFDDMLRYYREDNWPVLVF